MARLSRAGSGGASGGSPTPFLTLSWLIGSDLAAGGPAKVLEHGSAIDFHAHPWLAARIS